MSAKIAPAEVMRRAWALFSFNYNYPLVPFRSIGRRCFAWALRTAWAEARQKAALRAAMPADARAARVAAIREAIAAEDHCDDWQAITRGRARLSDEMRSLLALG